MTDHGTTLGGSTAAPKFSATVQGALGQSAADVADRNRRLAASADGLDPRNESLLLAIMRASSSGMTAESGLKMLAINSDVLDRNARSGGRFLDARVPRTGLSVIDGGRGADTDQERGAASFADSLGRKPK